MSHCKKFTPNIFNKIKCSNCFRQKEEHSAEALECNRASRSIARSGYLFVAPDWDFSVPLNRTKRWQRRWFVLYDDGELNYSVDEHPDTVPQGSVDMTQVLEVTGAEQLTGHPHSLALTGPDRVTFVKAASREDARWWVELLAVFPRRHKRNATFPGGRASPSLPQLGRSASPQPPRPRHLSCTGPSPRTNFTTPPLKEERESPSKEDGRGWHDVTPATVPLPIEQPAPSPRNDYVVSSGSPPTRDKLRCEDKARVRRDWRNERLRDIATALTDRSPESSLALPAEGLLNLKKGWLWFKDHNNGEWQRLWWVLCGPTLNAYKKEVDEQGLPEVSVELSSVTNCSEIQTETRYGFQIQWTGPTLTLSAVTEGIRSNWLKALKKVVPATESPSAPATPRSALLSSDEEYRTASEGGRRDSEDWGDYTQSSPNKTLVGRIKERGRIRPKLPRCHSRQSTVDSVSTDELDGFKDDDKHSVEVEELRKQLGNAINDVQSLESEVVRLKTLHTESVDREKRSKDLLYSLERTEKELSMKVRQADEKFSHEQKTWQRRITEYERNARDAEDRYSSLTRELQAKQRIVSSLQEELKCANDRLSRGRLENDRLYKKLQEIEGKNLSKSKRMASLTDLTDIDLEVDLDTLNQNELIEQCLDLRSRFEKAVLEIRAVKRELRESHVKYDELELENVGLKRSLEITEQESQAHATLMASRVQDLTNKLAAVEKQARTLKSKLQDSREKRRSLSLKGKESFSINKEVEDKVTELEAKILCLETGRSRRKHRRDRSNDTASPIDDKSLRRHRRKSLDSATSSEPMKLLMRLTTLESKVNQVNTSNESLTAVNASSNDINKTDEFTSNLSADNILRLAREKVVECQHNLNYLKGKKRAPSPTTDRYVLLETSLNELSELLNMKFSDMEVNVINGSVKSVVKQLENLLRDKLSGLEEKKNSLRETGQLDRVAKMEIFAEKIAYENLIIGRIEEAIKLQSGSEDNCERLFSKETIETANLLAKLQTKLTTNVKKEIPSLITSLDHLTKVLTKRLLHQAHGLSYPPKNPIKKLSSAINYLEEEQNKISNLLSVYKTHKLPALAEILALETLNMSTDESCRLQEATISDTWEAAREIVNSELITSEINHVLMRTAQKYEAISSSDQSYFFTFFAYERAVLELWSDAVENTLRSEMDRYIDELSDLYKNSLTKLQRQNWRRKLESERTPKTPNSLLREYADIIAHKALIDARILVLRGECVGNEEDNNDNNFVMNLFDLESYWDCMESLNLVDVSNTLESEFKFILGKATNEVSTEMFYEEDFQEVRVAVRRLYLDIKDLERIVCSQVEQSNDSIYEIKDVCIRCREMQSAVKQIKASVLVIKEKSCDQLEEGRLPLYLGTEYLNQVENLRGAYRRTLSECETHKQQADLEQLQIISERVLVSLEHWHRRTLHDLRETHAKELQALRQDKEQALAEETQATLAALDAMRKAHEAEVQREVAKFKQDFAREQQNELLQLNERLSVKCLEAAALQEQLGSATRQLSHAQQHILQLQRSPQIS